MIVCRLIVLVEVGPALPKRSCVRGDPIELSLANVRMWHDLGALCAHRALTTSGEVGMTL